MRHKPIKAAARVKPPAVGNRRPPDPRDYV